MKQKLETLLAIIFLSAFIAVVGMGMFSATASGATCQGYQGCTGYGIGNNPATSTVGQALTVASTSPWLTYNFSSLGGGGIASGTPFSNTYVPLINSVLALVNSLISQLNNLITINASTTVNYNLNVLGNASTTNLQVNGNSTSTNEFFPSSIGGCLTAGTKGLVATTTCGASGVTNIVSANGLLSYSAATGNVTTTASATPTFAQSTSTLFFSPNGNFTNEIATNATDTNHLSTNSTTTSLYATNGTIVSATATNLLTTSGTTTSWDVSGTSTEANLVVSGTASTSNLIVTGTSTFNGSKLGTNAFTSTAIPTTYVSTYNGSSGAVTGPVLATTTKSVFDSAPATSTPDIMFYTENAITAKQVDCVNATSTTAAANDNFWFDIIASTTANINWTATSSGYSLFNVFKQCTSTTTNQSFIPDNTSIPANTYLTLTFASGTASTTSGAYVDIKF
jgi:hypothetical protein